MKKINCLLVALLFCYSAVAMSQPTITFFPNNGTTLTAAEVNTILAANELTKESKFHAVGGIGIDTIGDYAFEGCFGLLSANFSNVVSIGKSAFIRCTNLSQVIFPNATIIRNEAF